MCSAAIREHDSFDWFTGLATVAAVCPPTLAQPDGMQDFYHNPNKAEFGFEVPRILMHECIHAFQLAGSRWLQEMVTEEWERLLEFERTGQAPAMGPHRSDYGRAANGMPIAVRDLVECLARFWDMHIRGPDRVLEEEKFSDEDGSIARLIDERHKRGGTAYSGHEYQAAMIAGTGADEYPRIYLSLVHDALLSPALEKLGHGDQAHQANRAFWAANVLLPVAGYPALNTDDPIRAFSVGVDGVLNAEDGLVLCTAKGNTWNLIELDMLATWSALAARLASAMIGDGLVPKLAPRGLTDREGWQLHPVWRHWSARMEAMDRGLASLLLSPLPPPDLQYPWRDLRRRLTRAALRAEDFSTTGRVITDAAMGLMGVSEYRCLLGAAFTPPLIRFSDRDLCATEAVGPFVAWPVSETILTAAVADAVRRHRALRNADVASRYGLPHTAFSSK